MARIEIQAAEMKENVRLEPLDIPIAIGFLDQRLDFIVQPLYGTVGDPVSKESQNIRKMPLTAAGNLLDGVQA